MLGSLDRGSLRPEEELPDLANDEDESELAVLLVPDADGPTRAALMERLNDPDVVLALTVALANDPALTPTHAALPLDLSGIG